MTPALYAVAMVLLLGAALMVIWRIAKGPTDLDRTLALDVLVVLMISAIAVAIVTTDTPPAIPILIVVGMAGFVGTVSVARFIARPQDEESEQ